ncbi:hypothetical protein ABZ690_01765 [Streptomyces sp. NPDC006967]|uniref:hypothetical protein n=1 Tax=unclassified Streptomyces TaxID=2593676 RepID=UPI0033DD4042
MTWPEVPFRQALRDVSGGNVKVPKSDFRDFGALPVVDQGQGSIAGYVNDPNLVQRNELPVIVFGDHTRCFKYVDFPFAVGADGVKILAAADGFDPRYLFWFLTSLNIPSAGYSRHYKYLKDFLVAKPPLAEQKRIATVLDQVDTLRVKRREAIALLGDLTKSIFFGMFGESADDEYPLVQLGDVLERRLRNGVSPSSQGVVESQVLTLSAVTRGRFDGNSRKSAKFMSDPTVDYSVSRHLFMICRGNGNKGLVGRGVFPDADMSDTAYPDTVLAAPIKSAVVHPVYLEHAWATPNVRRQIEGAARTTNGTYKVNQKTMGAVMLALPGMERQREFAQQVQAIEAATGAHMAHLATLDELFASLQHRAFSGTLWDHEISGEAA